MNRNFDLKMWLNYAFTLGPWIQKKQNQQHFCAHKIPPPEKLKGFQFSASKHQSIITVNYIAIHSLAYKAFSVNVRLWFFAIFWLIFFLPFLLYSAHSIVLKMNRVQDNGCGDSHRVMLFNRPWVSVCIYDTQKRLYTFLVSSITQLWIFNWMMDLIKNAINDINESVE